MNANTLLSIVFCFQPILCNQLPKYLSALCENGVPEQVLRMLRSSSTDTSDLHRRAQLCFNEAVGAENFPVITELPQHYPIAPTKLLRLKLTRHSIYSGGATTLLRSNWLFKGIVISGRELFSTHLKDVLRQIRSDNTTAIHEAAVDLGYIEVVKALVEGRQVSSDRTLELATEFRQFDIARYILSLKETDKAALDLTYVKACSSLGLELVQILCEEFKVDVNAHNGQAAIETAKSGNVALLEYLVSRGLHLSTRINEALFEACSYGGTKMVVFLLGQQGVHPAMKQNAALLEASQRNYYDIVDILLDEPSVMAALDPTQVNFILGNESSSEAKSAILGWMAYNMKAPVDMSWIPGYKYIMRTRPQSAAQLEVTKDRAIAELRAKGLDRIARFVSVWAGFLRDWAPRIKIAEKGTTEYTDMFEPFLSGAWPRHF